MAKSKLPTQFIRVQFIGLKHSWALLSDGNTYGIRWVSCLMTETGSNSVILEAHITLELLRETVIQFKYKLNISAPTNDTEISLNADIYR